ncbi:uncharacterized protein LOC110995992 isoform X2 [Pieris rapae]|uniref:uncharacterized protein LOC110995992 isoform X2 n=1 Tax=Pieris rapae TaxID=64459 RepID=UPI001E27E5EF|nr:uncharacterized protein LOC110995992 isoform X2 [Pieris rapae]
MDNDGRKCRKTKLAPPCLKSNDVVESTLPRIKRPCKKVLPAVAIATQSNETDTNAIREINPGQSNIMPMNFDVKVKVENVDKNAIEKQHEIISWREIVKESTEIYHQSNNICDKILHGQVLNTCKPDVKLFVKTPHEKLLDRAFTRWCDWASLTEEPKDPPLFYKCYICDMAWWHLAHFRDHIRTHEPSSLDVVLEMIDDVECNIVAYYTKSANKFIANIEGKCWKCGEKASEHTKLKNCVGCKKRFYTCSKLRQHQWYCEEFKKMHLDLFASAEKIFKCHLCRFYYFKKEDSIEHMILRHSVRSDVPIPGCSVCEKCKDLISYEDDHVCESKGYVKTCGACKKRVTESSAAVHQIEGNFTCSVCKSKIVKTCSIHLHALRHTMNYGLAYKCLTCKFFIIFDLEQIKNHKMLYHSNREFDCDLISVPKTIVDRLKSTPGKHDSTVDSQINTVLLSHDPQVTANDRADDDVIITDNVPKVIVIPSDDAPNDDLPCVIANIKSEPLENEIQTSETKHNNTPQNDFKCKTMVIQIPKDTKDVALDTSKNLEQITPKQSEVSGRIKVEKFEETVDEIDIQWHTVPIKKEADPEMHFKLSNIRSLSNVGENEIDVKQEINEFDLKGQSKYWFSFANNSHLITISPNVTLNTDDYSDDERNRSHRKMGNSIEMEVVADIHQHQQQSETNIQSTQTRPYSNAERQRRYREKRTADKMHDADDACATFNQSSEVQAQHDVQIVKHQSLSNAERQRKYRKSLREQQQNKSNTPRTSSMDRLQNVDQAELARKRYLNKQRQSRFRARRRFESPNTSQQAQAESTMEPDVQIPSTSSTPMETDDIVPPTSAIPFAVPHTPHNGKARRQSMYRKRKAAERTPAEAADFAKAAAERQRRCKQRRLANSALDTGTLESATVSAPVVVERTVTAQ